MKNSQLTGSRQRVTCWIGGIELLLTFALADAAVIVRSAGLMTGDQLIASAAAYILVAFGVLITTWQMQRF